MFSSTFKVSTPEEEIIQAWHPMSIYIKYISSKRDRARDDDDDDEDYLSWLQSII